MVVKLATPICIIQVSLVSPLVVVEAAHISWPRVTLLLHQSGVQLGLAEIAQKLFFESSFQSKV